MGVSVDGYISDRNGNFGWTEPTDELFSFHLERVRELGAHISGRRLYETMHVWESDATLRDTDLGAAFADAWTDLPKVVFSRTLQSVEGNARLATGTLADEIATVVAVTDGDVEIGGADLAGQAIELGLVGELRIFRHPVIVGGGSRLLPEVTKDIRLELVEVRAFEPGVIYERYRVVG